MTQLRAINDPLIINGVKVTIEDAARFAPVVRFHAKEQYFPCSIEFLLAGSTLVVGNTQTPRPTFEDLYAARTQTTQAHLRIDPSIWKGMPPVDNTIQAPMYVAPQVPADASFVDLTYYFLYAFNGPQTVWVRVAGGIPLDSFDCAVEQFAFHQGDVESITVRVTPDFSKIIHVGMSAHGDYTYYLPDELAFEDETHTIVNCAAFSHASYNSLDASRFIHPDDPTEYEVLLDVEPVVNVAWLNFMDDISWGNVAWRPFTSSPNAQLVFVGFDKTIDNPINGQSWTSFQGDLGESRTNELTDVIAIRAPLSTAQKLAFQAGGALAEAIHQIPEEDEIGNGPDGFGKRLDRMVVGSPVDLKTEVVLVVSRLSPVFALGVDPSNPTGPVTLAQLTLGEPPAFYHHWTLQSYSPNGASIVLVNGGTKMAAGVKPGSGPGTTVEQVALDSLNGGTKWKVFGPLSTQVPVALQCSYNKNLFITAPKGTNAFWEPVSVDRVPSSIGYNGQWGVVRIEPGKSVLALVSMYRSSHDDTLWWSAFDPATATWMPDARIGLDMSASSGPALAMLNGQMIAAFQGTDHQLRWTVYGKDGYEWQLDQPFGQNMKCQSAPALAVLDGVFYCVHRGFDDNELWWTRFDERSRAWIKDRPFGQGMSTSASPALAVLNGVLYCVHKGNGDDDLWWTTFDPSTASWRKDRSFGQGMTTRGVALAVANGVLYCVHRGTDDQLWWTTFDPASQTWQKNKPFGNGMSTSAAPALATLNGTLYCAHKGKDDVRLWWSKFDSSSGQWTQNKPFNFDIRSQDAPALSSVV